MDLKKVMTWVARAGSRRRVWETCALSLLLMGLVACALPSNKDQKAPEVAPRLQEPVALEVGSSETFTFKADGVWYPAPYMIYRGQQMKVAFTQGKMPCPSGAVRYRIGQMEQILVAEPTNFLVTRPGPMSFYFDPSRGAGFSGTIEVTITRVS